MATLEHELIRRGPERPREHHVFVSAGGRRRRALRAAGLVAGGLALVWLVALGLALAGSTRLPGLPVPEAKPAAAGAASAASTAAPAPAPGGAHVVPARPMTSRRLEPRPAARSLSQTQPVRTTPSVTRAAPVTPATSATSPAPTAATPTQGWSRHGWTAPPGQTKRGEPTPRGTGHPTDSTTTISTTHGNGHGKG
jgi:hypothetical protein